MMESCLIPHLLIYIYLFVNFQSFRALLKVSHFCCFHGNGNHFENSKVESLIYACQLKLTVRFIKFGEFWQYMYLTCLYFPWQRWSFWKFKLQKSHAHLTDNNHIKFHQFLSIFTFLLISMVTETIPIFLITDATLVHVREYAIKVSIDLTYHYNWVNATFLEFTIGSNGKCISSFHGNGSHFVIDKYGQHILACQATFP